MFRFLLRLPDGEPIDPAALVSAVPNWTIGETFTTGRGDVWRILAIETEIAEELIEQGINGVLTVEPAQRLPAFEVQLQEAGYICLEEHGATRVWRLTDVGAEAIGIVSCDA
jgi:hypothetical protein